MIDQSLQLPNRQCLEGGETTRRPALKVLFVVNSLGVGGIETYLLRFLSYAGAAIDATVLCKSGRGGALEEKYREVGARIVLLRLGTTFSRKYFDLFQMLRRGNWDSVCDFTDDFAGLVLFAARMAKVKTRLAFYRGSEYQFQPTPLRTTFARFLSLLVRNNASRVLSNSQVALDRFHPRWTGQRQRYRVIRNPAPTIAVLTVNQRSELRRSIGIPEAAIVITHVGRVAAAKNHNTILAVIGAVLERHPNAWTVLIGLGTGNFCESRVPAHIADRVKTFEYRSDVVNVLQASDLFLFPSLNEGMPNAMIEAMAAGCPIVASDIPSIKEVFPPSYSRYLFAPTDVAGGVERVESLIARPDQSYGPRLSEWVRDNFSLEVTFGAFLCELGGINCDAGGLGQ